MSLLDLVQKSLEGMRGDNALFTKTLLSLKTCCLGDPLLTPCLINVDDCTS